MHFIVRLGISTEVWLTDLVVLMASAADRLYTHRICGTLQRPFWYERVCLLVELEGGDVSPISGGIAI